MNRRQSTNVKLAAIINSKNEDNDEEINIKELEDKAKLNLRRSSLYGGGARSKIPKVKKQKDLESSPFKLKNNNDENTKPRPLYDSVPPGAHIDQFRIVT